MLPRLVWKFIGRLRENGKQERLCCCYCLCQFLMYLTNKRGESFLLVLLEDAAILPQITTHCLDGFAQTSDSALSFPSEGQSPFLCDADKLPGPWPWLTSHAKYKEENLTFSSRPPITPPTIFIWSCNYLQWKWLSTGYLGHYFTLISKISAITFGMTTPTYRLKTQFVISGNVLTCLPSLRLKDWYHACLQ